MGNDRFGISISGRPTQDTSAGNIDNTICDHWEGVRRLPRADDQSSRFPNISCRTDAGPRLARIAPENRLGREVKGTGRRNRREGARIVVSRIARKRVRLRLTKSPNQEGRVAAVALGVAGWQTRPLAAQRYRRPRG